MAMVAAGWLAAGPARGAGYGLLWAKSWSSLPAVMDVATGVATDQMGNIFVSGYSDRTDIGEDLNIVVLKYSPEGNLLWTRTHNSFPGGMDLGLGVAADRQGNCYVAGSVSITGGASEGWLRKYDPAGNPVWTMTYASPSAGEQAVFYGVAVDPADGSVYAAGCVARGDLVQAGNGLLVRVGPGGGAPVWVASADGHGLWDEYLAVALAPDGDVLVTGYETVSDAWGWLDSGILWRPFILLYESITTIDTDCVIARYSPGGTVRWRRTWGSENKQTDLTKDAGHGIAVNAADAVFVSGVAVATPAWPINFDRWVRCYSGDGTAVPWTRQTDEGEGNHKLDVGNGCAIGPGGRVIVAGLKSVGDLGIDEAMTLEQFDPALGYPLRSDGYQCCPFSQDAGVAVAVDPGGNTIVAGWEWRLDLAGRTSIILAKYAGPASDTPVASGLAAYPNPFDPGKAAGGTFKFANIPPGARVSVWTLAGLLVRRVEVRGDVAAWDGRNGSGKPVAPGAYYYTVEAPGRKTATGVIAVVRP